MPGQRYTSDRRRAPGQGVAGSQPVQLTGSRRAKRVKTKPGPLAFEGDGAVVCPDCGVGLDPERKGAGPGAVPKHARFGYTTSTTGRPPCRGWIESLPVGGGD